MFSFSINPEYFSWMFESKCANDIALLHWMRDTKKDFFHDKATTEAAKRYCLDCPFRLDCQLEAMRNLERYQGVMGGLSRRERNSLKKKSDKLTAKFLERMKEQLPDENDPIAS